MVGKFLLGMVSGGLLVSGGLVVGSMLFPTRPANDNRAAAPVEEPIKAPDATVADAGKAAETPAPEPEPAAVAPEPEAAPEPKPEPEPAAEAPADPVAPEAKSEEPAPAALAPAEKPAAQPAVTDVPATPEAPVAETATTEDSAPAAAKVVAPETAAEPSKPDVATADVAAAAPEPAPAPPAPEPEVAAVPEPQPASEAAPEAEVVAAEPAPAETATVAPEAEVVAEAKPATPVTEPVVEAPAENAPAEVVAEAAVEPEPMPEPVAEPAPEPAQEPVAQPAPEPAPDTAPATEAPVEEPPAAADAMPAAPEVEVAEAAPGSEVPEMPGTKAEALPETAEAQIVPDAPLTEDSKSSTFKPAPGLPRAGEGVIVGREAEPDAAPVDPAAPASDSRPIVQFATAFENPEAKPPFAIVLIDDGSAGVDRAGLATLPIPASVALDPLDPATPERAAAYRAAGKEVVMLVTGIADGAQASDVEVAFQSMAQGLPESVAVMDLATPAFQNNRGLSSAVVPILKAQGRGLLTWDEGLNAADQVARREDLEAATVFRDISTAGADPVAMRRLLDRAVFKAGQEGRVAVVGTANAATLAALLEWTVEGKAATVALAPLTAVLKVD